MSQEDLASHQKAGDNNATPVRKKQQRSIDTTENILAAAKACFLQHGFEGASISMIAKQAGVNNSLIFHHYDSKDGLWLAVRNALIKQFNAMAQKVPQSAMQDAKSLVRHIIETRANQHRSEPQFTRMLNWLRLEQGVSTHQIALGAEAYWLEALQTLQKEGKVDPAIAPRLILIWIYGSSEPLIYPSGKYFSSDARSQTYKNLIIHNLAESIKSQPD